MMNIRTLKKELANMKSGDTFYFNAIAGTLSMIDYIKELVATGKITPVADELNKMIKPDAQYKFYRGEALAPQMTYKVI